MTNVGNAIAAGWLTAVVPVRALPLRRLPPQAPALGCGSQTMRLDRGRARITAEVRAALADLGALQPEYEHPVMPYSGRLVRRWSRGRPVPGWLINGPEREVDHYVDITGTFDRKVAAVTPALGARGYPSRPENTPQGRFASPNSESGGSSSQVVVRRSPRRCGAGSPRRKSAGAGRFSAPDRPNPPATGRASRACVRSRTAPGTSPPGSPWPGR